MASSIHIPNLSNLNENRMSKETQSENYRDFRGENLGLLFEAGHG